jgi:stage III sporulation protein AA
MNLKGTGMMDFREGVKRFDEAVSSLTPALCSRLVRLPERAKAEAYEVRLKVNGVPMITCADGVWFVDELSRPMRTPRGSYRVTRAELADCVVSLCGHSLHTHQHEFAEGFISIRGGHRAGVCGAAVLTGGEITAVRDITSVNLRIAREAYGAADLLIENIFRRRLCGLLIVGAPSSGKTTILRDLARQLAGGSLGVCVKVAVVDERGELGAVVDGIPQNDLGWSCDILSGYPKAKGILTAVRTLSTQVIVCDEIGGIDEAQGIIDSINAGVKVIATAHAASFSELLRRPAIVSLLESGAFEKAVMLGGPKEAGTIRRYVEVGELIGKTVRNGPYRTLRLACGPEPGLKAEDEGCPAGGDDTPLQIPARQA